MSIEDIALDHSIEPTQIEKATTPQVFTRHTVFHSFLYDDSKQDSATNIAHRKCIIEFLKQCKILSATLITLWENTYGCVEKYICATLLYLMSVLSQAFYVIINRGISAPGD